MEWRLGSVTRHSTFTIEHSTFNLRFQECRGHRASSNCPDGPNRCPTSDSTHSSRARSRGECVLSEVGHRLDRKSTRLNSSHMSISYAVFCLQKKKNQIITI